MGSPFQHPQAGDVATPPEYGVRASYTGNIANLAAATTTCDGVTLVEGDLVLLTEQTAGAENGIYVVGAVAAGAAPLTRWEKCKSANGLPPGTTVFVSQGTARGNHKYVLTTDAPIVLGTTALVFVVESFTTHDHSNAANGGNIAATGVTKGTARQVLRTNAGATASEWGAPNGYIDGGAAPAFAANDCAITPDPGKMYLIPTTAGVSTVSITGTSMAAGDKVAFVADGAANGHTVQYRDGATAISSAKTALKRHCVEIIKLADGKLAVVGEISP
jgi:hypothetical protein